MGWGCDKPEQSMAKPAPICWHQVQKASLNILQDYLHCIEKADSALLKEHEFSKTFQIWAFPCLVSIALQPSVAKAGLALWQPSGHQITAGEIWALRLLLLPSQTTISMKTSGCAIVALSFFQNLRPARPFRCLDCLINASIISAQVQHLLSAELPHRLSSAVPNHFWDQTSSAFLHLFPPDCSPQGRSDQRTRLSSKPLLFFLYHMILIHDWPDFTFSCQ